MIFSLPLSVIFILTLYLSLSRLLCLCSFTCSIIGCSMAINEPLHQYKWKESILKLHLLIFVRLEISSFAFWRRREEKKTVHAVCVWVVCVCVQRAVQVEECTGWCRNTWIETNVSLDSTHTHIKYPPLMVAYLCAVHFARMIYRRFIFILCVETVGAEQSRKTEHGRRGATARKRVQRSS